MLLAFSIGGAPHEPVLAVCAGILSVLIWAYLLLARGGFWRVTPSSFNDACKGAPHLPAFDRCGSAAAPASSAPLIAAVIPARNEAGVIARSIGSLLNQNFAGQVHIFLVDDASTDATAQLARQTAAAAVAHICPPEPAPSGVEGEDVGLTRAGEHPALNVIAGKPLPPGWTGKLWAMQQGIEAAGAVRPAFFLLTDADILHAPDNLAALVAIAERGACDLTSFMVKLRCQTLAEKLLIPAFVFFFFKFYPPAWTADPQRPTAGAAGGCILLRPEALARTGGLQAIRGEIIDDCALAAAVKRSGGKLWLGPADSASSLRPYGSFVEIGHMIARSAFNQLQHSTLLLIAALAGLSITYLLPVALVFSGRPLLMALGAAAWAMMTIAYLPMLRYYRLNPLSALLLPLAAIFYMGATLVSAANYWSGRGGEWKGRMQDSSKRQVATSKS